MGAMMTEQEVGDKYMLLFSSGCQTLCENEEKWEKDQWQGGDEER